VQQAKVDPTPAVPLMDIAALAWYLAVNETFIRRLIHERRIPFHKLGKFVRFKPAEIDLWIEQRRVAEFEMTGTR